MKVNISKSMARDWLFCPSCDYAISAMQLIWMRSTALPCPRCDEWDLCDFVHKKEGRTEVK